MSCVNCVATLARASATTQTALRPLHVAHTPHRQSTARPVFAHAWGGPFWPSFGCRGIPLPGQRQCDIRRSFGKKAVARKRGEVAMTKKERRVAAAARATGRQAERVTGGGGGRGGRVFSSRSPLDRIRDWRAHVSSKLPSRTRATTIALRVPPLCLLSYALLFSSDHPAHGYSYGLGVGGINCTQGPSMLPTLRHFDVVLRETVSYRLPRWLPSWARRDLRVGDVVIVVLDAHKGMLGCRYVTKRVVATEFMEVDPRGHYAEQYGRDENWGIVPDPSGTDIMQHRRQRLHPLVQVPEGHLWLEGDSPPLSIDSRHYGPIPEKAVRGRIVCRIWPWQRDGKREPLILCTDRPEPQALDEYLDGRYGFLRTNQNC